MALTNATRRADARTNEDLERLQELSARQVAERLQGMSLLTLATVMSDGRPLTGPVDGILFRGDFYFSSGEDSLRLRHVARCSTSACGGSETRSSSCWTRAPYLRIDAWRMFAVAMEA